jgi:diacylglycerol kinase (ATP)
MTWQEWVSIAALVVALTAVLVGFVLLRRLAGSRRGVKPLLNHIGLEALTDGPPAFVVNPIKVPDVAALRRLATESAELYGLDPPLWYETTVEDPGLGQARQAVRAGASVVVAAGGDGTVRAVADGLSGSVVPMGLLPMGTGNLLARNLDLPLGDIRALIEVALTGRSHAIDVGYLQAEGVEAQSSDSPDESGHGHVHGHGHGHGATIAREHCFLVMAGLGFDAAMVAGADHALKKKVGWFAYFMAGVKHLHGRRLRVRMTVDDGHTVHLRLRSILFANCGRLPGGLILFPDAELDDGLLDIAGIDTRGGVIGWASLFGKVVLQGLGIHHPDLPAPGTIEFWRGRALEVVSEYPEPVQVDGDLVGEALRVRVRLRPGALQIRTR